MSALEEYRLWREKFLDDEDFTVEDIARLADAAIAERIDKASFDDAVENAYQRGLQDGKSFMVREHFKDIGSSGGD